MKKSIGLFMIFAMFFVSLPVTYAESKASVTLTSDKEIASPGDTVTLTVSVTGDSDDKIGLQGGLLRLTYDNTRLSFYEKESTFGTAGEAFTGYQKFTDSNEVSILNVQNYSNVVSDTDLPTGDCTYAVIKFKVNDDAVSGKVTFSAIENSRFTFTKERIRQYEISDINTVDLTIENKNVKNAEPGELSIANKIDTLFIKQTYKFNAETTPADAAKQLQWSVSDKELADVNPNTGIIIPKAVGTVTITVSSTVNPAVSDSFEAVIKPAPTAKVTSATVSVYDTIYANSLEWDGDKSFRINISLFDELGRYLRKSYWTDYYGIIYADNFDGLQGIKRDGNTIIVSKDAQDADNLSITANVISKINGDTVCTVTSAPFKVVSALNVSGFTFSGADATENSDGTYSLKLTSDTLKFTADANRTPYIAYSLNGGKVIRGDINIDKSELNDGTNTLVIYIHGDGRYSASGYKLNSLAKTVIAKIEK